MEYKVGDLVRVREDAGNYHLDNLKYVGQMGIIIEIIEDGQYPYEVKFIGSGDTYVFYDKEIERPGQ